jgi:hypothetical protein
LKWSLRYSCCKNHNSHARNHGEAIRLRSTMIPARPLSLLCPLALRHDSVLESKGATRSPCRTSAKHPARMPGGEAQVTSGSHGKEVKYIDQKAEVRDNVSFLKTRYCSEANITKSSRMIRLKLGRCSSSLHLKPLAGLKLLVCSRIISQGAVLSSNRDRKGYRSSGKWCPQPRSFSAPLSIRCDGTGFAQPCSCDPSPRCLRDHCPLPPAQQSGCGRSL